MGDAVLQITAYSMITALYQDQMMKYIGYIEIAIGIGLGMGPTVGSVVYSYVEYDGTMYFFGMVNLIGVLVCFLFIPNSLNNTISKQELERINKRELELISNQDADHKNKLITFRKIFLQKESFFAMFALLVCTYNISFFAGFISLVLVDHDLPQN